MSGSCDGPSRPTWASRFKDPEPLRLSDEVLAEYVGRYETIAAIADLTAADGLLIIDVTIRPEVLEQLGEEAADEPPVPIGILPGDRRPVHRSRRTCERDEGVLHAR